MWTCEATVDGPRLDRVAAALVGGCPAAAEVRLWLPRSAQQYEHHRPRPSRLHIDAGWPKALITGHSCLVPTLSSGWAGCASPRTSFQPVSSCASSPASSWLYFLMSRTSVRIMIMATCGVDTRAAASEQELRPPVGPIAQQLDVHASTAGDLQECAHRVLQRPLAAVVRGGWCE
jgi:hypothetical protein